MSSNGLSLGYRIGWRVRRVMVSVFGPAQLGGEEEDPTEQLYAEREAKIAAAKAKKDQPGG